MWISRRRRISAGFFPGATLDMNFAASRYLGATPSSMTVTRASTGYADDNAGVWSSFADNVARITNKGLLVEEARTNSIRNNSMQGAVAGTPGTAPTNWVGATGSSVGISWRIAGVGTENGIDYVDIAFSGTVSGVLSGQVIYFDAATNAFAASTSQVWTQSAFLKLQSGSLSGWTSLDLTLRENDITPAFLRQTLTNVLTTDGTLRRFSGAVTMGASTTGIANGLRFSIADTTVVNATIRIGWPQLELGAFVTSPIRTTSAAVTRAADAVSLTGANFTSWYTGTSHTLFGDAFGYTAPASSSVNISIVSIDDTTGNERIQIRRGDNSGSPFSTGIILDGGVTQANISSGTGVTMQPGKIAVTYAVNDANQATNGALFTQDTSVTLPTVTQMQLGNGPGTSCWNGYIRRVAYFPSRLANAELQAITT